MTNREYIASRLSEEELLCQIAEEASELAQAALKLRRAITQNNPTPVSEADARKAFWEEYGDLNNAIGVYREQKGFDEVRVYRQALLTASDKMQRWERRINHGIQTGDADEDKMSSTLMCSSPDICMKCWRRPLEEE